MNSQNPTHVLLCMCCLGKVRNGRRYFFFVLVCNELCTVKILPSTGLAFSYINAVCILHIKGLGILYITCVVHNLYGMCNPCSRHTFCSLWPNFVYASPKKGSWVSVVQWHWTNFLGLKKIIFRSILSLLSALSGSYFVKSVCMVEG